MEWFFSNSPWFSQCWSPHLEPCRRSSSRNGQKARGSLRWGSRIAETWPMPIVPAKPSATVMHQNSGTSGPRKLMKIGYHSVSLCVCVRARIHITYIIHITYLFFTLATSRAISFSHQTSIIAGFSQQGPQSGNVWPLVTAFRHFEQPYPITSGYSLRNLKAGCLSPWNRWYGL